MSRFVFEESGAVAILVAVAFPIFLLAAVLAVDVSRWNVHKRQLQVQADAAALAGGGAWTFPCDETSILNAAKKYAGDATFVGTRANVFQDIPDSRHHVLYNSPTWWDNRDKADSGGVSLTQHPCADDAIDVKVTETDVRAFFGLFSARYIDAIARAQLKEAAGLNGLLPVAVPDPSDASGTWVQFMNETTNAPIGTPLPLSLSSSTSAAQFYTGTRTISDTPDKVGLRVIVSANSSLNDCSQNGVECYDASSSTGTLVSIRTWPQTNPDAAATQPQPWVSAVRLSPGTSAGHCDSPYFTDVPVTSSQCTMDIFVTANFPAAGTGKVTNLASQKVSVDVGGASVDLQPPADTNPATSNNIWTGKIPVATTGGSTTLNLTMDQREGFVHGDRCQTNNRNNSACTVTVNDVQRTYGASALTSGQVGTLEVDEGATTFANSLQKCATAPCSHTFTVTMGLNSLHIATAGERPTVLRALFNQQNSSQNQTLICDPNNNNVASELTNGCPGDFTIAKSRTQCDAFNKLTDQGPRPWGCVETKGGQTPNVVQQAMAARYLTGPGNSCTAGTANRWSSYPNLPPNDPRKVPLFLTAFGAFQGSGKAMVPILHFAEFYITGWSGQGSKGSSPAGCNNDPAPGTKGGYLVGHFIKTVEPPGTGDTGRDCTPTSLSPCTAVLTR